MTWSMFFDEMSVSMDYCITGYGIQWIMNYVLNVDAALFFSCHVSDGDEIFQLILMLSIYFCKKMSKINTALCYDGRSKGEKSKRIA